MKRLFALVFALAILGCRKQEVKPDEGLSERERQIITEFRKMKRVDKLPVDSMDTYSRGLEKLAAGQKKEYRAMASIVRGNFFMNKSQYELSLKSFETALRLLKNTKSDSLQALTLTGIGNYYKNTGDNPKALDYLLKALKIVESKNYRRSISSINSFLGEVYLQKNDLELAKEHLRSSMKVYASQKWQAPYLHAAHTLANVYGMNNEFGNALAIDNAAIRICDSMNSPKLKVPFLDNKAMCYLYSGRLDSAQHYFNETLKIDLTIGDKKQIADSYSNLARLELMKGNFRSSEKYVIESISMLEKINNQNNLIKSYGVLAELYEAWGKDKMAVQAHKKYVGLYQALMNEKREQSMAEFKIVHETEKKGKIIAQNHLELLRQEKEVQKRNNFIIFISIVAISTALIGFLIYRQQRLRHRQMEQEHELKTAISQIETQNKLQEQRLDISRDLHDNIGAQLTFIISSVDNLRYAFDLKDTRLERKLDSINNFTKATIIELRDTIWAMNNAEIALEDLRIRIFNFIEKAKTVKENIDFRFHVDEELNELKFSSLSGMNLYRTIQEAVNNAVKYADAAKIGIFMECEDGDLRLRIEDDGKGFDLQSADKGNGLHNMQKRIQGLGGKFVLNAVPGQGTHIHILIPDICPVPI